MSKPSRLILASASPRRSELLQRMALAFEVCPAGVGEIEDSEDGPAHMVVHNAEQKARAVAQNNPDALVLGSDTTVVIEGRILGKPATIDEATEMLRLLSGREHTVFTGVALEWSGGGFADSFVDESQVRFKQLSDDVIHDYFTIVNPLDKAGSYGIQEGREKIIESVDGSVENVMGLPIQRLAAWLAENGFDFAAGGNGDRNSQ